MPDEVPRAAPLVAGEVAAGTYELEQTLERVRARNQAMLASRSWRWTAPARRFGRELRRLPELRREAVRTRLGTLTEPEDRRPGVWYLYFKAVRRAKLARGQRPRLLVHPDPLKRQYLLWKIVHLLGIELVTSADSAPHLAVWHHDTTFSPGCVAECPHATLNGGCRDISKRRVDEVSNMVFGYGTMLDPTLHVGQMVEKPDLNSVKEGRVITGPVSVPDPAMVYQRLLDNEVEPGAFEVLRVMVIGRSLPAAMSKLFSMEKRFEVHETTRLVRPAEVFSARERQQILELAIELGLDIAEVDTIRDRRDGRLYVIDANDTPFSPSFHLGMLDSYRAMHRAAVAFERQWGAQLRGEG